MTSTTDQLRVVFPHIPEDTIAQVVGQLAPNFPGDSDRLLDRATSELLRGNYENKKKKLVQAVDVDTGEEHRVAAPENGGRDLAAEKQEILRFIEGMAPNVDSAWLSKHFETFVLNGDRALRGKDHIQALLANYILEHSDYPKKNAPVAKAVEVKDYTSYNDPITSADYRSLCLEQLQQDFRWVTLPSVRSVLNEYKYHYCPAYRFLKADLKVPKEGGKPVSATGIALLTKERVWRYVDKRDPEFSAEYDYTHADEIKAKKEADLRAKMQREDEEAERTGQVMECGCCFLDVPLSRMVQCADGHLFCTDCIKKYVEETVYASGQTTVHCLDQDGCKANFPLSELERAVPSHQLSKIFARLADLDIKKAGLENIHQCPHCDFQMEIANPDEKLFICQNPECRRESCLLCKEPNHIPLRCEEVEKQNVTDYRKKVEEAMTASLVRTCPKCKAKFFKTEGCNKMTCSCGAHICYICRVLITAKDGYSHFCAHDRNPREFGACSQCKKCFLFLKSTEASDKELVEQAKLQTASKFIEENPELAEVKVGADEPAAKNGKKKKSAKQAAPPHHMHHQQVHNQFAQMAMAPFNQVANFVGGLFGMNQAPAIPGLAIDYQGRLVPQQPAMPMPPVLQPPPYAAVPQAPFPPHAHNIHAPVAPYAPHAARAPQAPQANPNRHPDVEIIDLPAPARIKRGRSAIAEANVTLVRPAAGRARAGVAANPIDLDNDDYAVVPIHRQWRQLEEYEEEEEEEDEDYEFDHQDDYDEDDFDEIEENY